MKKTLVVNFFGGPGVRKSIMASRIFSELKDLGINCEFATEYAKDVTWQKGYHVLSNQLYIFAKQQHRIWRLDGQVDIIVTDSPLLQSLAYSDGMSDSFKNVVVEEFKKRPSINILLERVGKYDPIGRNQTKDEAEGIDQKIIDIVNTHSNFDLTVPGEKSSIDSILEIISSRTEDINMDIKMEKRLKIQKIEEEILLTKKEKNKIIRNHEYEEAAILRDREKELISMMESLRQELKQD